MPHNVIENPMVIDRLWDEPELKVIGCCEGCGDDVLEGQDIYEFDGSMVHQNANCCLDYVSTKSFSKVAGE